MHVFSKTLATTSNLEVAEGDVTEHSKILKAQYKIQSPGRPNAHHFYILGLNTVHTFQQTCQQKSSLTNIFNAILAASLYHKSLRWPLDDAGCSEYFIRNVCKTYTNKDKETYQVQKTEDFAAVKRSKITILRLGILMTFLLIKGNEKALYASQGLHYFQRVCIGAYPCKLHVHARRSLRITKL